MSQSFLSRNNGISLFLLTAFIISGSTVRSQTVGVWNFTNTTAGTPGAHNTVSAATFSGGVPTVAFNSGNEYYGQDGWPVGGINTGSYMQFTLTPSSGYKLNMTSVVLRMRRSSTGSPAGSGPTAWSIRSSMDGYAADISSGSVTHGYINYTIPLGYAFTVHPTAITFRVYGYNVLMNPSGYSRLVFDQITVNGLGEVLPVRLTSFTATAVNKKVNLHYTLAQTTPGDEYELERSTDGTSYTAIHHQTESAATDAARYVYTDAALPFNARRLYYRLKVKVNRGQPFYSETETIVFVDNAGPSLFLRNERVMITGLQNGAYRFSFYSATGVLLFQQPVQGTAGAQVAVDLPSLATGIYFAGLDRDNEKKVVKLFVNGK